MLRVAARLLHTSCRRAAPRVATDAIRNMGIIAHIDAGKTTLTERILRLTHAQTQSAFAPPPPQAYTAPGDVDSGSTVTDFLEQERERGITIQSAAVGPVWWGHDDPVAITLVDTPGHVDFGMEVERTVRVVDGAVVVLDGVEGVEPQCENVWRQTQRYGVAAHLFFINKLDREGASVGRSVRSIIDAGMHERPVLLQLPAYAGDVGAPAPDHALVGVVDLLRMELLQFDGLAGEQVVRTPLSESHRIYAQAQEARHALVDVLGSLDDALLEHVLAEDDMQHVPASVIDDALRRLTRTGAVCPVLCGAAAANVGVQPLLDAIARYLPSPADKPPVDGTLQHDEPVQVALTDTPTSALAFKVVWDKRRGPITFVRVYSGTLHTSASLLNTSARQKERIARLLLPYADEFVDVPALHAGQIGVVLGLKETRTGDTLVDARQAAWRSLRLRRVHVPPPVFSVSVEARSKADEAAVADALRMLVRTDPSLHVSTSAQTVLSGLGELHLEIAKHRLEHEFGVRPHLGDVRVGYREALEPGARVDATEHFDQRVQCGVRVQLEAAAAHANEVHVDLGDVPDVPLSSGLALSQVLRQGALAALARGPLSGYPVQGVRVTLDRVQLGEDSAAQGVRTTVMHAVRRALGTRPGASVTRVMEPMMHVTIAAPATYAGALSSDISVEQHGTILDLQEHHAEARNAYEVYIPPTNEEGHVAHAMTIHALIPLAQMMRYSTRLRALTAGTGSYSMALRDFAIVSRERQDEILRELGRL